MSLVLYIGETLQVTVDANATTSESPFIAAWADAGGSLGNQKGLTTGTTAVVVLYGPTAPGLVGRVASSFSIFNADTVQHTYTIAQTDSSGDVYPSVKVTLPVGYTLAYENGAGWRVTDNDGNFRETVQAYQAGSWTVAVSNFPATQNVNQTELNGIALGSPSNYGTAPGAVAVQGVNAYVTNPVVVTQSGSWSVSVIGTVAVTQSGSWAVAATQSGTWTVQQGSAPWSFNWTALAGTTLGAPSNYGTSPGAVAVQGVNAYVTNAIALGAGSSTIGSVTQGTSPWTIQGDSASGATNAGNPVKIGGVFNTTQPTVTTGQTVDAQVTARGAQIVATGTDTFNVTVNTALPAGTNTIGSVTQAGAPWSVSTNSSQKSVLLTLNSLTPASFGSSSSTYLNGAIVTLSNFTSSSAIQVAFEDGGGNVLLPLVVPLISSTVNETFYVVTGLGVPMNNGTGTPRVLLTASPATGAMYVVPIYT
jgi:hypothetical protein